MKKILTVIICLLLFSGTAVAENIKGKLKQGVYKYKNGNYIGCMQTMSEIVKKDPANTLAHYYLAISYVQIGQKEKAIEEYNKVITINPGSQLATYALAGIKYLQSLPSTSNYLQDEEIEFIANSNTEKVDIDYYQNNKISIDKAIQEETPIKASKYKHNNESNNYYSTNAKNMEQKQSNTNEAKVTDKELADALRVIIKASRGYNANSNINPEMLQMSMMMNAMGNNNGMFGGNSMMGMNGGNNNAFNMLPMLMMYQNGNGNGKKIDPEIMKNIITRSMMPDMYSMFGSNDKK